ncbi:MAG: hypothetical protein AAGH43_07370 [Pseudomonadota bacterium]
MGTITTNAFYRHVKEPVRYALWFEFLAISPSYELARRHAAGESNLGPLPADFELVQDVFDDLGDVRSISFAAWWDKNWEEYFGFECGRPDVYEIGRTPMLDEPAEAVQDFYDNEWEDIGSQPTLIVGIPLGLEKTKVLEQVEAILEAVPGHEKTINYPPPRYPFASDRLRAGELEKCLHAVKLVADNPNKEYWRLWSQLTDKDLREDLQGGETLNNPGDVLRGNWGESVGYRLRRARNIAENAARKNFPNDQKCEHGLKLDFDDLRKAFFTESSMK